MKPYYQSERVTLYHGDCLAILPTLEAGSVDAVVTDPPYGVQLGKTKGKGGSHGLKREAYSSSEDTYENFVSAIVPRINACIDAADRSVIFTGPHIHEQRKPDAIGGVYASAAAGRHCWGFKNFLPVLLYGTAPDLHKGARHPTAIASNERSQRCDHPCPKPVGWMVWLVSLSSREDELILDPFMGSGTTGVACVKTGRRFVGIEIDEKYCEIAARRIEAAERDVSNQLTTTGAT